MAHRRSIANFGFFPLVGIAMALCSCAHHPLDPQWRITAPPKFDIDDPLWWWHPPKVTEIVPPSPTQPVEVTLYSEFSIDCSLRSSGFKHLGRVQATEAGLVELHHRQDMLLSQKDALLAQASDNMSRMVEEWHDALVELRGNTAKRWPDKSSKAYQDIIDHVLTQRQRQEYNYHKTKGRKRDEIWCWLFLSDKQKLVILQTYSQALQESQNAWSVSYVFVTSTHRKVDGFLGQMQRFIAMIEHVRLSHEAISEDIATAAKRYRQAGRELAWLKANLEAEDDVKVKIKLRKQIADKQMESKRFQQVEVTRQSRLLASHTWRMDEVAKTQDMAKSYLQALKDFHDDHCNVLGSISSFRARTSNACDQEYRVLRETLLRGMATARKHRQYLSRSVLRKVNSIPGGTQ